MKEYTVTMVSEEYGVERFSFLSLKESMNTIKRLLLSCKILKDGIHQIIGIEINHSPCEEMEEAPLLLKITQDEVDQELNENSTGYTL